MVQSNLLFIVVAMLSVVIGVNIAQFPNIDESNNRNYKALNRSGSSDIREVATISSPTIRGYYLPWIIINDLAPGAHLYIDTDSELNTMGLRGRILGFSQAESITAVDVSSLIIDDKFVRRHLVASVEDMRNDVPYFVIAMEKSDDIEVIQAPQRKTQKPNKSPIKKDASLLIMEWPQPETPFDKSVDLSTYQERQATYYVLAIDLALLDDDQRSDIGL